MKIQKKDWTINSKLYLKVKTKILNCFEIKKKNNKIQK